MRDEPGGRAATAWALRAPVHGWLDPDLADEELGDGDVAVAIRATQPPPGPDPTGSWRAGSLEPDGSSWRPAVGGQGPSHAGAQQTGDLGDHHLPDGRCFGKGWRESEGAACSGDTGFLSQKGDDGRVRLSSNWLGERLVGFAVQWVVIRSTYSQVTYGRSLGMTSDEPEVGQQRTMNSGPGWAGANTARPC